VDRIQGRLAGAVILDKEHRLSIQDLDNVVFSIPGILDYQAEVYGKEGKTHLRLKVDAEAAASKEAGDAVSEALGRAGLVKKALADGSLVVDAITLGAVGSGAAKRKIFDLRREK
jgi:phenylacetate-CoA ligase